MRVQLTALKTIPQKIGYYVQLESQVQDDVEGEAPNFQEIPFHDEFLTITSESALFIPQLFAFPCDSLETGLYGLHTASAAALLTLQEVQPTFLL